MTPLQSLAAGVGLLLRGLVVCVPFFAMAASATASDDACPAIAGISKTGCTTPLTPADVLKGIKETFWYDTDGVDPDVAGCHIGVKGLNDKTPNGRSFGEACQSNLILIESNPAKDVIHSHKNDIGSPYLVNCDEWCKGFKKAKGGACKAVSGPAPCKTSAKCECTN